MTGKAGVPGTRVTAIIRPRELSMLEAEGVRTGENVTDLIHKAIRIMDFVMRAEAGGASLVLIHTDGTQERIVILT